MIALLHEPQLDRRHQAPDFTTTVDCIHCTLTLHCFDYIAPDEHGGLSAWDRVEVFIGTVNITDQLSPKELRALEEIAIDDAEENRTC